MNTPIIKIDPESVEHQTIREIAQVIKNGEVIVYPTETFYGLGGDCFSQIALGKIFEIKRRPVSKGLPVLVSDLEMAKGLAAALPAAFQPLASRFWPGPLTLIFRAALHLPAGLVGAARTIGIRLPAVAWLQELIRETGSPLTATSANISGQGEIDSSAGVVRLFQGKVGLIVDGGPTPGGKPSTVIDLTGETPVLVREGTLSTQNLEKYLK